MKYTLWIIGHFVLDISCLQVRIYNRSYAPYVDVSLLWRSIPFRFEVCEFVSQENCKSWVILRIKYVIQNTSIFGVFLFICICFLILQLVKLWIFQDNLWFHSQCNIGAYFLHFFWLIIVIFDRRWKPYWPDITFALHGPQCIVNVQKLLIVQLLNIAIFDVFADDWPLSQ